MHDTRSQRPCRRGFRLAALIVIAAVIAAAAALAQGGDAVRATIDCPVSGTLNNVEAPILSGNDVVGQALTTSNGGWTYSDGSPASPNVFSYSWWRDGNIISGVSTKSYTLTSSDVNHNIESHVVARIGVCTGPVGARTPTRSS